jgi:hypothetical protein
MATCMHDGCSTEMVDRRAWTLGVQEFQVINRSETPDPTVVYNHARCFRHRQDLVGDSFQLDKVRACLERVRRERNQRQAAWKREKARRARNGGAFGKRSGSPLRV